MVIGLMGFEFESANKGCEALGYSFINLLLDEIKNNKLEFYYFSNYGTGKVSEYYPDINFTKVPLKIKDIYFATVKAMKKCDFIFDVTLGDSFSDIYSTEQCLGNIRFKILAEIFAKQYILLPQTYGPFNNKKVLKYAKLVLNKADKIYCRDNKSQDYLSLIKIKKSSMLITDMAFILPYNKDDYRVDNKKLNIGLNVSGLLWRGGFSEKNQFNLTFNYKQYIEKLLIYFIKDTSVQIHLISHVIDQSANAYDDDFKISGNLKEKYGNIILSPAFNSPIEAKSYISNMDVFIGSRMHSTIAAFSSGVPTIPVSYSRKFEGMYSSLYYPYIIHGNKYSLQEAYDKTLEYVNKRRDIKLCIDRGMDIVNRQINKFKSSIFELLIH